MSLSDAFRPEDGPVREHAALIFNLSVDAANAVRIRFKENGEELSQAAWFCVLMEYQNLHLFLTDRAVSRNRAEPKRPFLGDEFVVHCIDNSARTIFQGYGAEKISRIREEFTGHYRKSQRGYGACEKLAPAPGEGQDGTLIWEFAKTVGAITGHEADAAYLVFFTQIVNLPGLKLPELAARPSRLA